MSLPIFVLFSFYYIIIHHRVHQIAGFCLQAFKHFLGVMLRTPMARGGDPRSTSSSTSFQRPLLKPRRRLWQYLILTLNQIQNFMSQFNYLCARMLLALPSAKSTYSDEVAPCIIMILHNKRRNDSNEAKTTGYVDRQFDSRRMAWQQLDCLNVMMSYTFHWQTITRHHSVTK